MLTDGTAGHTHGRAQAPLGHPPALLLCLCCSRVVISSGHCPQFAPLAKAASTGNGARTEASCCQAKEHRSKAALGLFIMVPAKGAVRMNSVSSQSCKGAGRDRKPMSNAAPSTSSLPEQPDKPHCGQIYQQLPGEAFRCFPWHCGHGWQALHAHCTVAEAPWRSLQRRISVIARSRANAVPPRGISGWLRLRKRPT